MRVSPRPFRAAAAAALVGLATAAAAAVPAVAIVYATSSAPNEAERRVSARAAERIGTLLADCGIPSRTLGDDEFATGGPGDARVVILAYNPTLPRRELDRLSRFVGGGGRLIVFYSSDPALAALLGMRLGAYKAAGSEGQWSSFAFSRAAPPGSPARVLQLSRNIRPALPASADAQVIAWWADSAGRQTDDPAWVLSARGAWMAHILQDGDLVARRQMLLALVGHFQPAAWTTASRLAAARGGASAPYRDFASMAAAIEEAATASPSASRVRRELAAARALRDALQAAADGDRPREAVELERQLADRLETAFALAQTPRPRELCGVWNRSGTGLYPGDWDRTCRLLADHGVNVIFPNMAAAGWAHFQNPFAPPSEAYRRLGDQLAQCVAAARPYGIQVHVWKICWNLDGAPGEFVARMREAGRLQISDTGATLNWLCPSHPANIAAELGMLTDIVRRYPVQGIHLDYIRYPDSHACYCPTCRDEFESWLGEQIRLWPADVRRAPLQARYQQWRADRISRFVKMAQERLAALPTTVALSAAVYGKYPSCVPSVGQDWPQWIRQGSVSFVAPMNYTEDLEAFRTLLQGQFEQPALGPRIMPGIGVTAAESRLNAVQTMLQIRAARQAGARGFVLFDLTPSLESEILPLLRLGVTASL